MTTILLIRHAMTDAVGHRLVGWTPGIPLNEEGRGQAVQLAEALAGVHLDAIYSSPLDRAMETARAIAEGRKIKIVSRDGLGEVRFGDWTGRTLDSVSGDNQWGLWNTVRSVTRAPAGELMLEVQTRMLAELLLIQRTHPGETIAVVSHADPIRALLAHLIGVPLDLSLRIQIHPASVSIVRMNDGWWDIAGINARAGGFERQVG